MRATGFQACSGPQPQAHAPGRFQGVASGKGRVVAGGPLRGAGVARVEAAGLHGLHGQPVQRFPQGLAAGGPGDGHEIQDAFVLAEHLVAQPLDERRDQAARHRGDQVDPVGRERGGEHGHGQDQPGTKSGLLGVDAEKFAVGQLLRAADVQGQPGGGRVFQAAREVGEHVGNGDGLAGRVHPAGRDHHGQAVHEVADDFEGGAAGTENHGRPKAGRLGGSALAGCAPPRPAIAGGG